MAGRFAPSPTAPLHVGNLRTALVAWLMARSTGRRFVLRIEDLDQQRVAAAPEVAAGQLRDLAALGLDWDEVIWQSARGDVYDERFAELAPHAYECFCTRREIAQSAQAPHGTDGFRPYPGTCRNLSQRERAERRRHRNPALRIDAGGAVQTITDQWAGTVTGVVDDFVIRRNDGIPAYNFAVVVDDIAQGVDQIVRGDDLLASAPRQAWLTIGLGGTPARYAHVPLAVDRTGARLAKRNKAVTLAELAARGHGPDEVLHRLAVSLHLVPPTERIRLTELLTVFDPELLPRSPWVVDG